MSFLNPWALLLLFSVPLLILLVATLLLEAGVAATGRRV